MNGSTIAAEAPARLRFGARDTAPADPLAEEEGFRPELIAAGLCGLFGLVGAGLGASGWPLFIASYVAGGWFAAQETWELMRKRVLDVHFLMLLVAAGSAAIGGWGEGATLLFLFSLSGALERYAMGRTQREIRSLFKTSPKTALVLDAAGGETVVPVETLAAGQRIRIKPGDLVPVDSEILTGHTACDESNLTGEAVPVEKQPGHSLLAGTINLWGAVEARVQKPASESALQRIIQIIREAQHQKAPAQLFADRFSSRYTAGVLLITITMFFVWWLGLGLPAIEAGPNGPSAFYRTMTLLVVSSPCALVLSIPSAILSAIAFAARRGILFRGGAAVERLARITTVVLDKTGTLTTGELRVEAVESFPPGREAEMLAAACALEALSTHPLARAVTAYGRKQGVRNLAVADFESIPGAGLQGRVEGALVRLGKRSWIGTAPSEASGDDLHAGLAEVWVARDGVAARIVLRDDLRASAKEVISRMHGKGLRTMLLTGDRPEPARQVQEATGIGEVKASLRPEDKLRVIVGLKHRGERVAMIGDGVNDAPSLAAADVGVAMGARGSDAALEQADIVLMNDRLENFLSALELSQRARRVIQQNLAISLGTVGVLAVLAMLGKIPLAVGVIGHEGSTVVVVLNSLRLLLRGPSSGQALPPKET